MTFKVRPKGTKWLLLDSEGETAGVFRFKSTAEKVCRENNESSGASGKSKKKKSKKKKSEK